MWIATILGFLSCIQSKSRGGILNEKRDAIIGSF